MILPKGVMLWFEGDSKFATVMEDLHYVLDDGTELTIRKGYKTDGASRPEFGRFLVGRYGDRHRLASIMHDALYDSELVGKNDADMLFNEAMKKLGVPTVKRLIMYYAVKMFGDDYWYGNTLASIRNARQFITIKRKTE